MSSSDLPLISWLARARTGSAQPHRVCELWLGKPCVIVAWLGLLLAMLSPPHESGIQVCWLESATGLPCLGCGVTRSLSCGIRAMWLESWNYHPMGLAILALFAFTAAQSLLPGRLQIRLTTHMQTRAADLHLLYLAFVTVFVAYGLVRALIQWTTSWMNPAG